MGGHAGKSVADAGQKQDKAQMGVFQHGVRCQAAADDLYQYLQFFGRPRRMLAERNKRTKNEISKLSVPGNAGGLLLKMSKNIADYQHVTGRICDFSDFSGQQ